MNSTSISATCVEEGLLSSAGLEGTDWLDNDDDRALQGPEQTPLTVTGPINRIYRNSGTLRT